MAQAQTNAKRTCFVIGPIGAEGSAERKRADWLFHLVIEPALSKRAYDVKRADHLSQPGLIDVQIIQQLQAADLVIADLSEFNPNVFYEIGIRHCFGKPIIHMYSGSARIPFDVSTYRAITYSLDHPKDMEAARAALDAQVVETEADGYRSLTPVQFTLDFAAFKKSDADLKEEMLATVMQLSARVTALEGRATNRQMLADALHSYIPSGPGILGFGRAGAAPGLLAPQPFPDGVLEEIISGAGRTDVSAGTSTSGLGLASLFQEPAKKKG
ncbi:MAG TPA: hypothetical protein VFE34_05370 [Dongiaceae bacterium]|jgi:hypothetical protein|nr:hypothetical protein [Dongiaceae bacterium]